MKYTEHTECPTLFHRWCAISILATYMGRRVYFKHGHMTLHPNAYILLIGSPGTKKSTAIKIAAKLLKLAGYSTFAAKKTRQEKFLLDLAEQAESAEIADMLDKNLFGDMPATPAETLIAADEFNNFIGLGNLDFISILGELWDIEGVYDYKLKNSKSVFIPDPTINILGGNTPTGLSQAFPQDVIGQGFFSRLLLIFSEPTGVKYTFPPEPNLSLQAELIAQLHSIRESVKGEMKLSKDAEDLVDKIYKSWEKLDDVRFEHYANRRLTHLLKLSLVMVAARAGMMVDVEDIVSANTYLTYAEHLMPKALGEFGRARNSAATHKLMEILDNAKAPVPVTQMWKLLHQDFESRSQLHEILGDLVVADKIQNLQNGFLPKKKVLDNSLKTAINWELLTPSERAIL